MKHVKTRLEHQYLKFN